MERASIPCAEDRRKQVVEQLYQPAERAAVIFAAPFAPAAGLRLRVGGLFQLRDHRARFDRLLTGGAVLVAGVTFRIIGRITLIDDGQGVGGKGLFRMAADVLLAVVAIHACSVTLDRAGGSGRGDVRCVDVVGCVDGDVSV